MTAAKHEAARPVERHHWPDTRRQDSCWAVICVVPNYKVHSVHTWQKILRHIIIVLSHGTTCRISREASWSKMKFPEGSNLPCVAVKEIPIRSSQSSSPVRQPLKLLITLLGVDSFVVMRPSNAPPEWLTENRNFYPVE